MNRQPSDALAEMYERDINNGVDPLAVEHDRQLPEPRRGGLVIERPEWLGGDQ